MEVIPKSSTAFVSIPSLTISDFRRASTLHSPQVFLWNYLSTKKVRSRVGCSSSIKEHTIKNRISAQSLHRSIEYKIFLLSLWKLNKRFVSQCGFFVLKPECLPGLRKLSTSLHKAVQRAERFNNLVPALSLRLIVGVMFVTTFGAAVSKAPSWGLSEENLLFLEAWRTIDRAYIDKTFNGQSWFRYRESALRNEPMNTREETSEQPLVFPISVTQVLALYCNVDEAIRKMVATLDDPFTRFLEPQKFKSLRSGTRNTLTGVGISIGYPTAKDKSSSGLVIISAAPGGPANRAGILSGDVILAIDDTSTENMGIYDAAERLQMAQALLFSQLFGSATHHLVPSPLKHGISSLRGPEGSGVELIVRHASETRHLSLIRERVSLNPVKSRICKAPGLGDDAPLIGYIKLTSFNQNASGAVREAIETLRGRNVNSFILDLRDNSGGLFPEGVEIAKIWLEKGVIVYICDSRGVRDIYDTDGSNAAAPSEPLVVLVNKGTASASEILAGALKDNKRAVLFGEPTYGKGKIQSVFELSDGSGLAVTVARYETPAHNDIDKVGIIPDRPLPISFPKDEDSFCGCLQDPGSACYLNRVELFSR
ncbi:hypothetical protein BUALT_Bualt12G0104400 [Buddleja alternifolia]|uniref:PDZ domain-containing protein n=1 Tax=Buddleja alternifolia TaxID=168488 RepID=A0AAV6WYM9_9LAMI|nr:hypothetical protein BUALT_Bualt12G0104400 [Buddleja alternifolia]